MKITNGSEWALAYYRTGESPDRLFKPLLMKDISKSPEDWFAFLENQGMPSLGPDNKFFWEKWHDSLDLKRLSAFIRKLQTCFDGPEAEFILFPLTPDHTYIMKELKGRNGYTFPGFILAFWSPDLEMDTIKALLLHEYHHLTRIHHLKLQASEMTLLDSMVMEGLAEWEVRRRLGKKSSAPWVKRYSRSETEYWWNNVYRYEWNTRGRASHGWLLYGGQRGIPPLMGYQLGCEIVADAVKTRDEKKSRVLASLPSRRFLEESYFGGYK